jgi:AP-2 complex subunit mu-1
MDYGIPQITDAMLLKKYIQEGGLKPDTMNDI